MTFGSPIRQPSKKQLEQAYVDGFLAESRVLLGASAQAPASDPPDFFINHDGASIAIEVRRVFADEDGGSKLREAESLRQYVCKQVEEYLVGNFASPQQVLIGFIYKRFSKDRAREIAARIIALLTAHALAGEGTIHLTWRQYLERGEYGSVWPEELDHISKTQHASLTHSKVTAPDAGFQVEECVPILQAAISEKNADLLRYSSAYGEKWLLLVAEAMGPSSFISPDGPARTHRYVSDFNRVFFFEYFGRKWCELTSVPGGSAQRGNPCT